MKEKAAAICGSQCAHVFQKKCKLLCFAQFVLGMLIYIIYNLRMHFFVHYGGTFQAYCARSSTLLDSHKNSLKNWMESSL